MSQPISWIHLPAGTFAYGDAGRVKQVPALWVSATPITVAQAGYDTAAPDHPVTGICHCAAAALAERLGGRLPSSVEWEWIAAGAAGRTYPWGEEPATPGHALLTLSEVSPSHPGPVGHHAVGATPEGIQDLAGNVWEWTSSRVLGEGFIIRGGSYASKPLYATCRFLNAAPAEMTSPGIGLRVVKPA